MVKRNVVVLDEETYREECDAMAGLCLACGEVVNHGDVEPDAVEYECQACGEHAVMGLENALLGGDLEVVS